MSYAVTYSREDISVHGWNIEDIEENGRRRPHVYFKLNEVYGIVDFVLHKKILAFHYGEFRKYYLFDKKICLNKGYF